MNGTYDIALVILSMAVAVMASYVAIDLASRVTAATTTKAQVYWLIGGALSMGIGIWSMHFIGMLAFRMPIPMSYDIPITLLSLLIAAVVSGFALYMVSRKTFGVAPLLVGGALMGVAIASMHYTGMAAMQMLPPIRYDPLLFTLSILITVAASIAALWIAFQLRSETTLSAFWKKAGSAVIMGAAICGMHYTGMAAAVFTPNSVCTADPQHIDNVLLAGAIGFFTIMWLATTLLISVVDARLVERAELSRSLLRREALERAKAERALEKEKQFLVALLESLADGIVACDEHGILTLFNRATREFHGLPEQSLSPDKWAEHYDLCLPDGKTPMTQEQIPLFRAHAGHAVRNVEMVIVPKDGSLPRRTVVCNGRALVTSYGKKLGAVVAMRDITENKRMGAEIRTKSARLAEAQRIARVGSWDWDFALDQIAWSDELYRIFGIRAQEFGATYEAFFAYVHPEDRVFVKEMTGKAVSEKKFSAFYFRIVRPDGAVRVMHADGDMVADQLGEPTKMTGILQDITERERAEDRLRMSEERFQFIARATNDTVWDWNMITGEQWWSGGGFRRHWVMRLRN